MAVELIKTNKKTFFEGAKMFKCVLWQLQSVLVHLAKNKTICAGHNNLAS